MRDKRTSVEKYCTFAYPLGEGVRLLRVKLGWDMKEQSFKERLQGRMEIAMTGSSKNIYDLNLAAIVEYSDGSKPELIYHHGLSGHGCDETGSILLGKDDRTGFGTGSDETMDIHMLTLDESVSRIILFMNIGGANAMRQKLADVDGVFVQIENVDRAEVILREEEAFKTEEAKKFCEYTFAEICREKTGWVLRGRRRYSVEDNEHQTLRAEMGKDAMDEMEY